MRLPIQPLDTKLNNSHVGLASSTAQPHAQNGCLSVGAGGIFGCRCCWLMDGRLHMVRCGLLLNFMRSSVVDDGVVSSHCERVSTAKLGESTLLCLRLHIVVCIAGTYQNRLCPSTFLMFALETQGRCCRAAGVTLRQPSLLSYPYLCPFESSEWGFVFAILVWKHKGIHGSMVCL